MSDKSDNFHSAGVLVKSFYRSYSVIPLLPINTRLVNSGSKMEDGGDVTVTNATD